MKQLHLVLVVALLCAGPTAARAQLLNDDFESLAAGDVTCANIVADGKWVSCKEQMIATGHGRDVCGFQVVTSTPGGGPMPSGTKALRFDVDATVEQAACALEWNNNGASSLTSIPALVYLHAAVYVDCANTVTTNRFMKMWYASRDAALPYPVEADPVDGSYWLLELGRLMYMPFDPNGFGTGTPPGYNSACDSIPVIRDHQNTNTVLRWHGVTPTGRINQADPPGTNPGAPGGEEGKWGPTSTVEHLRGDGWRSMLFVMDTRNASACHYRLYIGDVFGGTMRLVENWQGGSQVQGSNVTCTTYDNLGHRWIAFLSTVPANAVTGARLRMFVDDVRIGTAMNQMPAYAQVEEGAGSGTPAGFRSFRMR